jgi:hypothetical protein
VMSPQRGARSDLFNTVLAKMHQHLQRTLEELEVCLSLSSLFVADRLPRLHTQDATTSEQYNDLLQRMMLQADAIKKFEGM